MLQLRGVKKSFSEQNIIRDASFFVNKGDKICIVGRNGTGKSTLINIILGNLPYEEGEIKFDKNKLSIGWMPQTISDLDIPDDKTVRDFLLSARPIQEISDKIAALYMQMGDPDADHDDLYKQLDKCEDDFQRHGGYNAESDLSKLIVGFSIDEEIMDLYIKDLSGGQKSKIAFIRLLYSDPDILILDEPTNHLDKETKDWVMNYLKGTSKTILAISHDEEFLNDVVNRIVYMNHLTKSTECYPGNYAKFCEIVEEKSLQLTKTFKTKKQEIDRLQTLVDKYHGISGKRKKQAQSKEKMLDRLKETQVEAPINDSKINLVLTPNRTVTGVPLSISKLDFSYTEDEQILKNVNFSVLPNERFIVVGSNGAGKSTLLRVIAGELKHTKGDVDKSPKLDIGYYAQEHESLDQDTDLISELANSAKTKTNGELRRALASFNFKNKKIFQKIGTLSPGEKSRLALLKLCLSGANMLLLDEPTNHLDLHTKQIVAGFLKNYGGTIVLVSHDEDLVQMLGIERMIELPSCKVKQFSMDALKEYHD